MINKLKQSTLSSILVILFLLPVVAQSQQLVTWTNLVNTTVSNNVLSKSAGANGWNAGAESQNMLAFGQDGWVEFTLQEVTKTKAIGISYEPSTTVLKDSIKYGFIFTFSGSNRVLKTKKLNDTSYTNTYNLNDVFRIEKAGTKILFLKNGVKLDSATMSSNDKSFFIDASISTLGGQFHNVRTCFPLTSSTTINPDKDAYLSSYTPTTTGGSHVVFKAGYQTNSGTPNTMRSLMEFDLSAIPQNAKIVNARLFLYARDTTLYGGHRCDTYCTGNSASLFANTSSWTESTVTWNTKPTYNSSIYFSIPNQGSGFDFYTDVVTEARNVVQKWVEGSIPNYGVTFKVNNEVRYTYLQFKSSDDPNTPERPRLEVKYYIGTKYYVNDNSTVHDVYCKVVGNASNTGLSPYSPKTSVSSILSTYVLGPKDTIFVDAGTYTEAITFTSTDCGSTLGQLVVHGAGSNHTKFNNVASNHNIYLNNADYVTIENLKLNNTQTGSYYNVNNYSSQNMVLQNDSLIHSGTSSVVFGSSLTGELGYPTNSRVYNCIIKGNVVNGKQIVLNGNCPDITISDNQLQTTYDNTIGIQLNYIYASSSYYKPSNTRILNNTINADSIGIHVNGHASAIINKVEIINNTVTLASSGTNTYGVLFNYSGSSSSYIDTISGNTIIGGGYGIKASYFKYAKVYNNYLVNNTNGISLTSSQDNLFAYNNFRNAQTNFTGTTSDVATNTTLSDNIFVSTGNSTCYNLNLASGTFAGCDYNCYYNPNGAQVAVHAGKQYSTLSSWQGTDHYSGTGNGDEHSISADPLYPNPVTNNLDIDLFSPCTQAGSAVSGITTDIYGRVRRSLATIGANEPVLFLNIPVLKNSVLTDEDTIIGTLTGSGIDTTFVVPDTFLVYPTVPLEGYLNYEISFEGDTSLIDDSSIGFRVNSLGKIDSVYEKSGSTQSPLDPSYYTLFNLNRGIAASAIMKLFPAYTKLSEVLDGGYYIAVGKRVKFYYWEEYNVSSGKVLEYKIYDKNMNVIASVSSEGLQAPSNSPLQAIKKGQNKVTLNLTGISGIAAGEFYIIEVSNTKDELLYLRFRF